MRYDLPIPYGWFCVGLSSELEREGVKPLRYFGEDLVMYRTASGQTVVLDAYCPHLGAHLGHGGQVDGESIACPFHGWQFNAAGHCTAVPYATRIPPKVQGVEAVRPYPVKECNGLIWVWYHPRAIAPLFDIEIVPELDSTDWSELDVYDWEIGTIVQETGENAVDTAHFIYVHKVTSFPAGDITIEGHRRTTDITMKARAVDPETGVVDLEGEEVVRGHLVTKSIGPGQTVQYLKTYFETIMIGTITPIDSERVHLRFCFSQPASVSEDQASIARSQIDATVFQVTQDIPIWENKLYIDSPLLCDGDGPIHKYRKWFSQFYDQPEEGSDSLSA